MECGRTVIGGEMDEDDKYIAPTILVDITPSDAVMQEEVKSAIYSSILFSISLYACIHVITTTATKQ